MYNIVLFIKVFQALRLRGNRISKNNLFQLKKYTTMSVTTFDTEKYLRIHKGNVSSDFFYFWLRDHCRCDGCYNQLTFQRKLNVTDISFDVKPRDCVFNVEKDALKVICKYFSIVIIL